MRRPYSPFNNKRFIGNTNTNEVHDLDSETSNCKINEIKHEHVKTFSPDTHAEAENQDFDNCAWCIGNSKY